MLLIESPVAIASLRSAFLWLFIPFFIFRCSCPYQTPQRDLYKWELSGTYLVSIL